MNAPPSTAEQVLDGPALLRAFAYAAGHLADCAAAVDAINEYPVPDGDTGSNMSATLRGAVEQAESVTDQTVGAVLKAIARGALYGARGNSGIILSQALKGLAAGVGEPPSIDAKTLAHGMTEAAKAAYSAVTHPVEGTMLTVLRVAAERAEELSRGLPDAGVGADPLEIFPGAVLAAEDAEAKTMEQLDVLREAGVPDAGGEGICVILRGLIASHMGTEARAPILPYRELSRQEGHGNDAFGFCVEFLLEPSGTPIDIEALRALAIQLGGVSVVVVGDETLARLHVHTEQPDALIEAAGEMGTVSRVKIDDMSAQHVRLRSTGSGAGKTTALLALANGAGFEALFESLGAATAPLGEFVKPSAGDIATAADALNAPDVIVLPNHRNVMLAARQAASLARCTLHVAPATGLPKGIAAAIAYDGDALPAANLQAMERAMADVSTIEVTIAVADRLAEGIAVKAGQAIAMLDGTLVAAEGEPVGALIAALTTANAENASLITVYLGEGVSGDAETLGLAERFEDAEIEVVDGGQPLYQFIASVER